MNENGGYDTKGFMEATGGTITTSGDYKFILLQVMVILWLQQ